MSEQATAPAMCPLLGLPEDRESRFMYAEEAHRCFAADRPTPIALDHQTAFCLTANHPTCPRYVDRAPLPAVQSQRPSMGRVALFGLGGLLAGVLLILGLFYARRLFFTPQPGLNTALPATVVLLPTPTVAPTNTPARPTPSPAMAVAPATPTLVAVAGAPPAQGELITVTAAVQDIGWVVSDEERGNHFGDSFLYAGIFGDKIYYSVFRFNLDSVPRGAPIYSAKIELTGLRDDLLAADASTGAAWTLRLLQPQPESLWTRYGYQDVANASARQELSPVLGMPDLAAGQVNQFDLSETQVQYLLQTVIDDPTTGLAFRLAGPVVGEDNLFAWDTGYGPKSNSQKVRLILDVGQPPATPPPFDYLVVTSTPTPENVMTAAAMALQMTAEATRIGTATPAPENMVTPTPIPDYLVVVSTALPLNTATAQAQSALATAIVLATGTATPTPNGAVTATPTFTPSPTLTRTPLPPLVLITATPTSETVFAAATISARQTALAAANGTATPLPPYWVTPIVVTATPTPANASTARAISLLATAMAFTTGTPTPTPPNVVTATPTPVFNTIPILFTPTPSPVAGPPPFLPPALLGKILFKSDREAGDSVYVFDPETGQLGRLTDPWPYDIAHARNAFSADTVFQTYTKQFLWTADEDGNPETRLAIHYYDYKYNQENIVTRMGVGIVYDSEWSPVDNRIVFVATESGNDEIWVINYDGSQVRQLTRNTWEWDKSPSWSPDGKQIVFFSNRTGNDQLWIMDADGGNQRPLMGWENLTAYNDRYPVWVKYLDPPPAVQPQN